MHCSQCRTRTGFYTVEKVEVSSLKVTDDDVIWAAFMAEFSCGSCGTPAKRILLDNSFQVGGDDEYLDRECDFECNLPEPRVRMLRFESETETKTELLGLVKRRAVKLDIWIEKHCDCGKWHRPDLIHFVSTEEAIDSWVTAPPPTDEQRRALAEAQKTDLRHAQYLAPFKDRTLFIKVEIVSRDMVYVDYPFKAFAHTGESCATLNRTGKERPLSNEVQEVKVQDDHFVSSDGRQYHGRICTECVPP